MVFPRWLEVDPEVSQRRFILHDTGQRLGLSCLLTDNTSWRGAKHAVTLVQEGRLEFDKELDARGLSCPLPILRAKKALAELTSGQTLRIVATDQGAVKDFIAFTKQTGNELLSAEQIGKEYVFLMRKR